MLGITPYDLIPIVVNSITSKTDPSLLQTTNADLVESILIYIFLRHRVLNHVGIKNNASKPHKQQCPQHPNRPALSGYILRNCCRIAMIEFVFLAP